MFQRSIVLLFGALCLMACDSEHWRIPQFGRSPRSVAVDPGGFNDTGKTLYPAACRAMAGEELAHCLADVEAELRLKSPTFDLGVISDPEKCRAKMLEYRALVYRLQFGSPPVGWGTGVPVGVADCPREPAPPAPEPARHSDAR